MSIPTATILMATPSTRCGALRKAKSQSENRPKSLEGVVAKGEIEPPTNWIFNPVGATGDGALQGLLVCPFMPSETTELFRPLNKRQAR